MHNTDVKMNTNLDFRILNCTVSAREVHLGVMLDADFNPPTRHIRLQRSSTFEVKRHFRNEPTPSQIRVQQGAVAHI